MKIRISTSANQDLVDGFHFYEKQSEGLGAYFIDSLFSDIDSLKIYAGIHSVHFNKYFRLLSKKFPFAIYYLIEQNSINVYAILDTRSNPAWIRKKLK